MKIFVGGFPASGTSIIYKTLLNTNLFKTTGKYIEGQKDPNYPTILRGEYKIKPVDFYKEEDCENIRKWLSTYHENNDDMFIEKCPRHFLYFNLLQNLYPQDTYFILIKRNPYDIKYSQIVNKKWGTYDPEIECTWRKLEIMINFMEDIIPKLDNILIVEYENFTKNPEKELKNILKYLGINNIENTIIKNACQDVKESKKYPLLKFTKDTKINLDKLCQLWNY